MGLERLAPNSDAMTAGDRYVVRTEECCDVTLEVRRNGPYTSGYFIAFAGAEPPVTETLFFPGEIFVKDDEVTAGKKFVLSSLNPLLSRSVFRALEINLIEPTEVRETTTSQQ
jgi:hypothetical protein